jgi:hypothetical protein
MMMTSGRLKLAMDGAPKGARLFMGLSGGLDSAYVAWRMLKAGHPMLFHCCEYRTYQKRYVHEVPAQNAILNWFTEQGLDNFTVHRTMVDIGQTGYVRLDDDYMLPMAGVILRAPKHHDIHWFVRASGAEDRSSTSPASRRQIKIFYLQATRKDITIITPKRAHRREDYLCRRVDEAMETLGMTL